MVQRAGTSGPGLEEAAGGTGLLRRRWSPPTVILSSDVGSGTSLFGGVPTPPDRPLTPNLPFSYS